jgi:hypothetical protein
MRTGMLLAAWVAFAVVDGQAQTAPPGARTYVDPQKRFEFSYPDSFGSPAPGTDSGFQNRVAAIRFTALAGLGGEAALTSGFIDVDIQALGGLYDAIARSVLPDPDAKGLVAALPRVTPANFCALLGAADRAKGLTLPPRLLPVVKALDASRNVNPVVRRCGVSAGVAVFHKETTFESGTVSTRQHVFGALRFLAPPYSSFQFVRGLATPPAAADLDIAERIVRSFVAR